MTNEPNPIERIVGTVFSGFMCKLYAAGFAVWIASEAVSYFTSAMRAVTAAMGN